MDSHFYRKNGKGTVEYLRECFAELHRAIGLVFMAVCSGGAKLTEPGAWSASFQELLQRVPEGVRMIIPIVGGSDFLVK